MATTLREQILTHISGLQLLARDLKHLETCLLKLPGDRLEWYMKQYRHMWENGEDDEHNVIMKPNAGRKAANLWIGQVVKGREIVAEYGA